MNRHPSFNDLLNQVRRRHPDVRQFLTWAGESEASSDPLRAEARRDITDAREAVQLFSDAWWGLVVFCCFGSLKGAQTVTQQFRHPVEMVEAERILADLRFEKGTVGHHRIRPGLKGAKQALLSACANHEQFRTILLSPDLGFHERFQGLRELRARQWGRTTCFDSVLRAGALAISGRRYFPDRAYLKDSGGPEGGFQAVWGIAVTKADEEYCEGLLKQWSKHKHWFAVARAVGVTWPDRPYTVADLENALCIYKKHLRRLRSPKAC